VPLLRKQLELRQKLALRQMLQLVLVLLLVFLLLLKLELEQLRMLQVLLLFCHKLPKRLPTGIRARVIFHVCTFNK